MTASCNSIVCTWKTVFTEWRKKTVEKRMGDKRLGCKRRVKKNRRRTQGMMEALDKSGGGKTGENPEKRRRILISFLYLSIIGVFYLVCNVCVCVCMCMKS